MVITYSPVRWARRSGLERNDDAWSIIRITRGCSICVVADAVPMMSIVGSVWHRQVTLSGPNSPSSCV
jgi:hypothetical protein